MLSSKALHLKLVAPGPVHTKPRSLTNTSDCPCSRCAQCSASDLVAVAQAFKAADSGVYCGPLRLLAVEVHERLNAEGCPCNLVTGQERRMLPDATHLACTVEMSSTTERVDVAVIDEIQVSCMVPCCARCRISGIPTGSSGRSQSPTPMRMLQLWVTMLLATILRSNITPMALGCPCAQDVCTVEQRRAAEMRNV